MLLIPEALNSLLERLPNEDVELLRFDSGFVDFAHRLHTVRMPTKPRSATCDAKPCVA